MTEPKVSIITVVFNRRESIAACMSSVNEQVYENVEHVVIDGQSTDGTLEIVRRNLSRGSVLVSEPDAGIYDAINKGIERCSGEIIGLLHSDDLFFSKHTIYDVVRAFEANPVEAVFGDVEFFRAAPANVVRRYRSNFFRPSRMKWGWFPAHTSLFLRREVYQTYGLYKTDFRIAADIDFLIRIFRFNQISWTYLPEVLVKMAVGGISTSGIKGTIRLNQEVHRALRENGVPASYFRILSKYPLKALEFIIK